MLTSEPTGHVKTAAMAMLETDFTNAIEAFASTWQLHRSAGGRVEREWEDVRVLERFGTRYLRITKLIPAPGEHSVESHESEGEAAIEEDDTEALIPSKLSKQDHKLAVQYDVVYSPAYQVPVLYITLSDAATKKSIALPSPDELYRLLVPDEFKSAMRDVGVMGALSMSDHPVTGVPAYFVHPCRTQEALAPFLEDPKSDGSARTALDYLMLWFGVIGASVGLSVPVNVARLLGKS